jgi:hypothetical protein
MKRTSSSVKTPNTASSAKPAAKSPSKPLAAAKKAPAKKSTLIKSPSRPQPAPAAPATPAPTKQSQLIALLGSSGATLAQMMTLTGWQAHTVRGMLSGSLRKRLGLNVQSHVEEGVRVYRIVEGSAK